ncbi:MarR family winged helix-turn-helix transcriptional regulator [Microbaculum sp. FT89]|uniref:MarR family winged helix-turn-helix transcriptional regulator n=1 Tax=Microbaculum sp. FT89 TaxID=3447298 RepID=UPI003F52DFD6
MAAKQTSLAFHGRYESRYRVLRNEWRVLFHLGCYGAMTAQEISTRARLQKTKVSRAVAALHLQEKRYLERARSPDDRRKAELSLTKAGLVTFNDLTREADRFETEFMSSFSEEERQILRQCLRRIAHL